MERIEDMPLSESEMNRVKAIYDQYGTEAGERTALDIQASKYREKFLKMEKLSSYSRMCYSSGSDRYTRIDLASINEEDIRAVQMRRIGQGHHVSGEPGGNEIIHNWHVDSGD